MIVHLANNNRFRYRDDNRNRLPRISYSDIVHVFMILFCFLVYNMRRANLRRKQIYEERDLIRYFIVILSRYTKT